MAGETGFQSIEHLEHRVEQEPNPINLTIYADLDGVGSRTMERWLNYSGVCLSKLKHITQYSLTASIKKYAREHELDQEAETAHTYDAFAKSDFFLSLCPNEAVRDAQNKAKEELGARLIIATDRGNIKDADPEETTKTWLKRERFEYDEVRIRRPEDKVKDVIELAKRGKVVVLEDCPSTVQAIYKAAEDAHVMDKVTIVLLNRPWTRNTPEAKQFGLTQDAEVFSKFELALQIEP